MKCSSNRNGVQKMSDLSLGKDVSEQQCTENYSEVPYLTRLSPAHSADCLSDSSDCENHYFTQLSPAKDCLSDCGSDDIFNELMSPAPKKNKQFMPQDCNQQIASCGDVLNESDLLLAAVDLPCWKNNLLQQEQSVGVIEMNSVHSEEHGCKGKNSKLEKNEVGLDGIDILNLVDCLTSRAGEADQVKLTTSNQYITNGKDILSDSSLWHVTDIGEKSDENGHHANNQSSRRCISATFLESSVNEVIVGSVKNEHRVVRRLTDRIKCTLRENAKINTPVRANPIAIVPPDDQVEVQRHQREDKPNLFHGLPVKVKQLLETQRSISSLYPWQEECLSLRSLTNGGNLIYSLPTSGGKTLVAEMLIFRELLSKKKDALLVLPFVALVQEKVRGLSVFATELDFNVEEYAASKGQFPPRARTKRKSLYVATIEKANSLINSLIECGRISDIGLVVVDELHMLGEGGSRGAVLEMSLIKLMHASPRTQIVGMSATLNNVADLQTFLSAEIYTNNFRPVELNEYVKIDDAVYVINTRALSVEDCIKFSRPISFKRSREQANLDVDYLAGFIMEVVPKNSCLVFCPTKKNCENVAQLICRFMSKDQLEVKKNERRDLLDSLRNDGAGELCPVLRQTIPYGVAYHHSGLTMDERRSIEEAYLEGTLCMLACTSTLAAGVNLPAKRVILRSPYVGQNFLSRSQYKQMTGRAGRAGLDAVGESILIINQRDKLRLMELVHGPYDTCRSSLLYDDGKGVRTLILTAIGLQLASTETGVASLLQRSLCSIQSGVSNVNINEIIKFSVQSLVDLGLVSRKRGILSAHNSSQIEEARLDVTSLGRAIFKGSVDINWGKSLYDDLIQSQQSLVVANHLHLLYLATPYDMVKDIQPDWMIYLNQLSNLSSSELKVANLIGVSEGYIAKMAAGRASRTTVNKFVVCRFYLTLMLYELWRQRTIWQVAVEFRQSRGFLQQLLSSAASFASCISHFCQELEEFWAFQDLLSNFVKKLSYCCSMELIPLMEIPGVKLGRARQLYKAGLTSLQHVAFTDPEHLVKSIQHMSRKVARQIVSSAKLLLTEKADALREEAEELSSAPKLANAAVITPLQAAA